MYNIFHGVWLEVVGRDFSNRFRCGNDTPEPIDVNRRRLKHIQSVDRGEGEILDGSACGWLGELKGIFSLN